jgi:hypothetical protein
LKLTGLDKEVKAFEDQLVALEEMRTKLSQNEEAFIKSQAEITSLVDRLQKGGDDVYTLRSALRARLQDLIDEVKVSFVDPRHFTARFKDGTRRVVCPAADDPAKFIAMGATNEEIVSEANIRFLLARFGITSPTPAQYDEMASDLSEASRLASSQGDEALRPLERKWEKRRAGLNQSVEVMVELKKKYREPGIE